MTHYVIDIETGIHNRGEDAIGKNKAAPWHEDNKGLYYGISDVYGDDVYIYTDPIKVYNNIGDASLLIGQNIKFDLHYIFKDVPFFYDKAWPDLQIWDTQLAEYILTGQQHKYAKLDDLSTKYGGVLKDSKLSELWNGGMDTEDMSTDLIEPYLITDVENTRLIFQEQLKAAKSTGMLNLIKQQMRGLKATVEMEWHGMYFDKNRATRLAMEGAKDIARITKELDIFTKGMFDKDFVVNYMSQTHVALCLFGGDYTVRLSESILDEDGEQVVFKSGARKGMGRTKYVKHTHTAKGYSVPMSEDYLTPTGKPKVNDDVLSSILDGRVVHNVRVFIGLIKELRTITKDVSTYYNGYSSLTWPNGIIHQSLNHVSTDTGRLSCTAPNLQNVTSTKG